MIYPATGKFNTRSYPWLLAKTGVDADEVLAVHTAPHEALGALRQELRAIIRQEVTDELVALRQEVKSLREQVQDQVATVKTSRDEAAPRRGWWPWGKR